MPAINDTDLILYHYDDGLAPERREVIAAAEAAVVSALRSFLVMPLRCSGPATWFDESRMPSRRAGSPGSSDSIGPPDGNDRRNSLTDVCGGI